MNRFQNPKRKLLVLLLSTCFCAGVSPSLANVLETMYVLPKAQFEKFCELAKLIPEEKSAQHGKAFMAVATCGRRDFGWELKDPEYQRMLAQHTAIRNFLEKNAKQPYSLNWRGAILVETMEFLKKRGIDLHVRSVCEEDGEYEWYVFDKTLKDKYLEKMNPANFSPDDLKNTYLQDAKAEQERTLKSLEQNGEEIRKKAKMTKKQLKQMIESEKTLSPDEDFPERGKAMLDAIKYLYQYLQLVDDETVVMLHFV